MFQPFGLEGSIHFSKMDKVQVRSRQIEKRDSVCTLSLRTPVFLKGTRRYGAGTGSPAILLNCFFGFGLCFGARPLGVAAWHRFLNFLPSTEADHE
jgi:hypothetical protein